MPPNLPTSLRQRLLLDIAELQGKPYPNITLHVRDEDISKACLVLAPEGWGKLHLTVEFGTRYPLSPPKIRMDSLVQHPNVFDDYICASILNTREGYTPAYTLKGIAIQLLSFFGSENIEQSYGNPKENLAYWRDIHEGLAKHDHYQCSTCRFNADLPHNIEVTGLASSLEQVSRTNAQGPQSTNQMHTNSHDTPQSIHGTCAIRRVPDELVLLLLDKLEFEELTTFARAWPKIGWMIARYDIIRTRELQCFCLKKSYNKVKLGVGVSLGGRGQGTFASEFDLLSKEAFKEHNIRHSVHGIPFQYWLPLPISYRHWRLVQEEAEYSLRTLKADAALKDTTTIHVLYVFMNDVVVKLNQQASANTTDYYASKSTLKHASEKAIESYFHLFHLLVCRATINQVMVMSANRRLQSFIEGKTSKQDCPNLGHLLIALLISDIKIDDGLIKAIITEAITRNVVWVLDERGAGMTELSYMEPSAVSDYRLHHTFQGSKTSYRLLMFSELFRRTARPSTSGKTLVQIRDELFSRHGAPPMGAAARLSAEVRRLHDINNFPAFLKEMGMKTMPSKENFTTFLRDTMKVSVQKGYSKWGVTQGEALYLRRRKEPNVEGSKGVTEIIPTMKKITFFPDQPDVKPKRTK